MKARDLKLKAKCDTPNKQNVNNVIECFNPRRQIQVKRKEDMLFTNIFMMFINIQWPQNAELCDSHKKRVLNMQVLDCPGANIMKMTEFAQSNIVATIH